MIKFGKLDVNNISIDHLIDDRLFEPQRLSHSYLQIEGLEDLVDIHGYRIRKYPSQTLDEGCKFTITPDNLLRVSLASHGMPSQSSDVIRIRKGNEEVKFAGGVTYDDIDVSFTDWIGADIENLISAWDGLRYNPITGVINPAYKYKKTGSIVQYSPDGEILRTWILKGVWLDAVKYGDYDRSSTSEVRQISGIIHIDKAYPAIRQ